MALISCPECGKQVSELAPSCMNCGVPIAYAKESYGAGAQLSTIQQTSKKFKIHTLISIISVIIGFILYRKLSYAAPGQLLILPLLLILFGITGFIFTRIRVWWHHK